MKKIEKIILAGLISGVILTAFVDFNTKCQAIRDDTLRLHIIANSDSELDQQLKLKVRDKLLQQAGDIFDNAGDKEDAKEKVNNNLEKIKQIASDEIKAQNFNYQINATVCNMFFETKEYEEFTMPAGFYDALRITIGEGLGKNWWCVMFPPLCIPAMTETKCPEDLYNQDEIDIIENQPEYQLSFACVEILEKLKASLIF